MDSSTDQSTRDLEFTEEREYRFRIHDYVVLLKPRVMSLVVFTAVCGLVLAPGTINLDKALLAILCIAAGASAAGAINMWYDQDIDRVMIRALNRPIPSGRLHAKEALAFGAFLSIGAVYVMANWVNIAATVLLAVTILYYIFIYTIWLKRRTPQNIVIGGASGALPPMIGWAAVTGAVYGIFALLLGIEFWRRLWTVWNSENVMTARPFFLFSILYLFSIFAALLFDRLVFISVF